MKGGVLIFRPKADPNVESYIHVCLPRLQGHPSVGMVLRP